MNSIVRCSVYLAGIYLVIKSRHVDKCHQLDEFLDRLEGSTHEMFSTTNLRWGHPFVSIGME